MEKCLDPDFVSRLEKEAHKLYEESDSNCPLNETCEAYKEGYLCRFAYTRCLIYEGKSGELK